MQIEEYLSKNGIAAEAIHFENPVKTTADCEANGIPASKVVKSILLILDEEKPLLAVLLGSDSIAFGKVRRLTEIKNIRTARPEEVLTATGFEVGGVIPFIPGLETVIDTNVMVLEEAYSGGGDASTLLRLNTSELSRFGRVENIHKEEDPGGQDLNKPGD